MLRFEGCLLWGNNAAFPSQFERRSEILVKAEYLRPIYNVLTTEMLYKHTSELVLNVKCIVFYD
jgi:hypothetical protein